ncbi:MAG TPA: bacteriohemerythrin [Acetobacteraceae bacterium]|jgi:hemerythrin
MPLLTWTEKLSVGVTALDDDHKRLVAMINELFDSMQAGQGREVLGRILDGLVQYTKMHFAREESFFAKTSYAAAAAHKQEHDALTRQVLDVQRKYAAGAQAALTLEILQFLKNWLIQHIQGSDQKYRMHLNANGIR